MKPETFEIVVPVWPQSGGWEYFGDRDYTNIGSDIASAFVSLRAVREGDKYPWFTDSVRAINNLGLYIYFDNRGTVSIDLRYEGHGRQTLSEMECGHKQFKKLRNKILKAYPMLNNFVRDADIQTELTLVIAALGVKRSICYERLSTEQTFLPLGVSIKKIAEIIEARRSRLAEYKAA